jgi:5-methylthioadenosine/S-adenosylhomocysteine deaminase
MAEELFIQQGEGPIAAYYHQQNVPWNPPRTSTIAYLDRLGALDDHTQLVHCVHLAETDFEIMVSRGTSVAHCPKSNAKLANGQMNLNALLDRKIPVGLGSDSVASNNLHDLFEEMRMALFLARISVTQRTKGTRGTLNKLEPGAAALLRMATLGGAEALQLEKSIGSIEKGKYADLIAVDLANPHSFPVFDPVESLVYSARGTDVLMTMVGGQMLWERGKFYTLDAERIKREVEQISGKLAQNIQQP